MTKVISEFQGSYRFLSNFYSSPIKVIRSDITYDAPTVEHAYQAFKAIHLSDFEDILSCHSPGLAKRKGRVIYLRTDWEAIKLEVMRNLLAKKFSSKKDLGQLLLSTGAAILEEGNHWGDTYWGVCNGKGKNWLGHLLMARRAELAGVA
jgi:ribA/ribD-fused uncharacterized protein